jgi:hypothetical protein
VTKRRRKRWDHRRMVVPQEPLRRRMSKNITVQYIGGGGGGGAVGAILWRASFLYVLYCGDDLGYLEISFLDQKNHCRSQWFATGCTRDNEPLSSEWLRTSSLAREARYILSRLENGKK